MATKKTKINKNKSKIDDKILLTDKHLLKKSEFTNNINELSYQAKSLYNKANFIIHQVSSCFRNEEIKENLHENQIKYLNLVKEFINVYNNELLNNNKLSEEELQKSLYKPISSKNRHLNCEFMDKFMKSQTYINSEEYCEYKNMPSRVAQGTLKLLEQNWQSFFKGIIKYAVDPNSFNGRPKPPKYYKKDEKCPVQMSNQAVKTIDNEMIFRLKQLKGLKFKTRKDGRLKALRFNNINNVWELEAIFELNQKKIPLKTYTDRMIGIDIGVNNFATVSNNIDVKPFYLCGRKLKSINQLYNKKIAYYKSILDTSQKNKPKDERQYNSKRLNEITLKRRNQISNELHNMSKYIVNWCIEHKIDTIVIGKNKNWKQESKMGKKNNQKFIQIPHAKFINILKYKSENVGIKLIEQEESYTSKASFLDKDIIPTYKKKKGDDTMEKKNVKTEIDLEIDANIDLEEEQAKKNNYKFSGYRAKRGMYKSKLNGYINADLNGSYNIMKKFKDFNLDKFKYIYKHPERIVL